MFITLLASLLATAPAQKVALPTLNGVDVSQEKLDFYTEQVAHELSSRDVHAVTPRDIEAVVGLERQKELMGCSEAATSCMAELAGALGVDGIILGDVAKIGSIFQVSLKLVGSKDGRVLRSLSERVHSEEEVLDAIARQAEVLARLLTGAPQEAPPPAITATAPRAPAFAPRLRPWAWLPLAAGAAAGVGSGAFFWVATDRHQRLTSPTAPAIDPVTASTLQREGDSAQLGARVLGGVAIAGAVVAAAFWVWPSPPPALTLTVSPDSAAVVWAGVLP